MKKGAVIAGFFVVLFLGSALTAHAGTHYSFGFSIGVGPAVPYGYYPYPAYPYPAYPPYYGYYAYPYYYPSYTYVVPGYSGYYRNYGYGGPRRYDSRSYNHGGGNRVGRGPVNSNPRSHSNRGRY